MKKLLKIKSKMENLNADVCPLVAKPHKEALFHLTFYLFDYFVVIGFLALLGYIERTTRIPPKNPWTLFSNRVTDGSIITVILRLFCVFCGMGAWFLWRKLKTRNIYRGMEGKKLKDFWGWPVFFFSEVIRLVIFIL